MDTLSRRSFVVGGLAVGFAAAVEPVSADTITTDAKGLVAGEVKIKGPDGVEFPAYRAMPDKGDRFPVLLVVEEIFGVHEHIQDVCRRFAKKGYLAIAPELFARQGSVSKITAIPEIQRPFVWDATKVRNCLSGAGCSGNGRPRRNGRLREKHR